MKVLLAEDDPATRRVLEKAVRGFGHEVVATANGCEAWDRFLEGDFNFVITDWMMPECDGLELCRRIRKFEHPSYVYLIMATSNSGREDLITGMDAGADEFIVKPINHRELQARMRAAERILNLQRELKDKNQQLEEMNTRLQRLSRMDALMQVGNRLAFEEKIAEFHARALRYGSPYGVVMSDVDHFKSYNDTHGHPAGDEVLRRVARAIGSCLRASDGAFRYGGEEIVVLLPEQTIREAEMIAARLRATVESLQLRRSAGEASGCVTISCGVAASPMHGHQPDAWETVIGWADQALYRAKAAGRNRVELADAHLEVPVA